MKQYSSHSIFKLVPKFDQKKFLESGIVVFWIGENIWIGDKFWVGDNLNRRFVTHLYYFMKLCWATISCIFGTFRLTFRWNYNHMASSILLHYCFHLGLLGQYCFCSRRENYELPDVESSRRCAKSWYSWRRCHYFLQTLES